MEQGYRHECAYCHEVRPGLAACPVCGGRRAWFQPAQLRDRRAEQVEALIALGARDGDPRALRDDLVALLDAPGGGGLEAGLLALIDDLRAAHDLPPLDLGDETWRARPDGRPAPRAVIDALVALGPALTAVRRSEAEGERRPAEAGRLRDALTLVLARVRAEGELPRPALIAWVRALEDRHGRVGG